MSDVTHTPPKPGVMERPSEKSLERAAVWMTTNCALRPDDRGFAETQHDVAALIESVIDECAEVVGQRAVLAHHPAEAVSLRSAERALLALKETS